MLEDIAGRFGDSKAKEISDKLDRFISNISTMPELFRASKKRKGLRKCVFSRQTSIYYRVKGEYLEIVSLRPNRMDPKSFRIE